MIHRFRGVLAVLAATALLLAGPAQSDLLSRSAYDSAIATNLPDNTTGAISEQDVRDAYTDLADSVVWKGEVEHRVINMSTTTPPASPTAGDSYVVGASATGAWSGQDGNIAVYDGDAAAWVFFAPVDGLSVWNQADDTAYRWDAGASPAAWAAQATGASLAGLSDVTVTGAASGDILEHDGSGWVNRSEPDFAEVRLTTAQSISTGVATDVAWDTETSDVPNWWASGTPTRITPTAGYYDIQVEVRPRRSASTEATVTAYVATYNSGGTLIRAYANNVHAMALNNFVVPLTAMRVPITSGDYIKATVLVSANATDIRGDGLTFLKIRKVQ